MGEYFGNPHHWRMCSKDSMKWACWKLAAISRTAPSSVSKSFSMRAFARTTSSWLPLEASTAGLWETRGHLSCSPQMLEAWGLSTPALYFLCPRGPLPLHLLPGDKGHFSKRWPTEPPSLGRKKAPDLTPEGGLTVHYQLSPRKPQSAPPPPVHGVGEGTAADTR